MHDKIKNEDSPCPNCGGKIAKRKRSNKPIKDYQKYYFIWYWRCLKCASIFHDERAKVMLDSSHGGIKRAKKTFRELIVIFYDDGNIELATNDSVFPHDLDDLVFYINSLKNTDNENTD